MRVFFVFLIYLGMFCQDPMVAGGNFSTAGSPMKIAFCITGQLARLEMLSKIQNVLIPNAKIGNIPHAFIYLDSVVDDVAQTYWNYNYSNAMYNSFTRQDLKAYIDRYVEAAGFSKQIRVRVKLEPPPRYFFHAIHGIIPVNSKAFSGHDGPKDNFEPAETRFQNNMRWMAGMRECVRWAMLAELQQGWHYDLIVRLRDDTYAFGQWLVTDKYKGAMTSAGTGSYRGINDHNFVLDRYWADNMLRGLVEDYYFNSTLENVFWGNPERRFVNFALFHLYMPIFLTLLYAGLIFAGCLSISFTKTVYFSCPLHF